MKLVLTLLLTFTSTHAALPYGDRRKPAREDMSAFLAGPPEDALPEDPNAGDHLGYWAESFADCPDMGARQRELIDASALAGPEPSWPDPQGFDVPDEVEELPARTWRGWPSDVDWAERQLKTRGVVGLRSVVPLEDVAALRAQADRSWCAIAEALAARNRTHCLAWGLQVRDVNFAPPNLPPCGHDDKFTFEYNLHEPSRFGGMEMIHGAESPAAKRVLRKALAALAPVLRRVKPDFILDERGFFRNQSPMGGYWHHDVDDAHCEPGTSYTVFVTLQAVFERNGVTRFVPWGSDAVEVPNLPAGSVLIYDTVGLPHRVGEYRGPPPGHPDTARWILFQTMVSSAHPEQLHPFQVAEKSVFRRAGPEDEKSDLQVVGVPR